MRRRRRAPVSNLRASLGERIRSREESAGIDWEDEFKVQRPSLLGMLFGLMHRHLKLKVSIAVVLIFICALLQYMNIPFTKPVLEGLEYVTTWDIDYRSIAGKAIPAFKMAWAERKLPEFNLNPVSGQKELLPLKGEVVGKYGIRVDPGSEKEEMHYGIDLIALQGTEVKAVLPGRVEEVVSEDGAAGLLLGHDSGWQTLYLGLGSVTVSPGDSVEEGQVLGVLGSSSDPGSSRLHFELRYRGCPVEPPAEWVNQFESS